MNSDSESNSILDSSLDSEISESCTTHLPNTQNKNLKISQSDESHSPISNTQNKNLKTSESNNLDNLADIVWFRFDSFYDGFTPTPILDRNGNDITLRHRFEEYEIFKPTSLSIKQWLILHHNTNRQHFAWVWGGIFKFSLLKNENIRFLNGLIYEDNLFGAQLFLSSQNLIILPQNLYVWRARLKSTMTQHEDTNKNFIQDVSPYIAKIYGCFKTRDLVRAKRLYFHSCFGIMLFELIKFLQSHPNLDEQSTQLVCQNMMRNYFGSLREFMGFDDDAFGVKNKLEIFQPYIKYGSFESRLAFNNTSLYRFIVLPLFTFLRQTGLVCLAKKIRFKLGL